MSSPPTKPPTLLSQAKDRLTTVANTLLPGQSQSQDQITFPPFDSAPKVPGQPQGCLWSFFDDPKSGKKDQLGTLNLLTPSLVQVASSEIRTGQHVQLDNCLTDFVQFPGFGRKKFEQRVIDHKDFNGGKLAGFDDEVHLNTQSGSQWDSLKHYATRSTHQYYNGLTHDEAKTSDTNGLHNVCERGGIVGRGVLVDWLTWYEKNRGMPPSATTRHEIPVSELDECLKWQGTTTRQGDILIVRGGYTKWHNEASADERRRGTQKDLSAIGLESSETTVRWMYDHHFAAVAGDMISFEAWPFPKQGWVLHEWLLVHWGTPIGELWNLEELSEMCQKENRWTFFLTSAPLYVKGGVGSPPGAIAIF